VSPPSPKPTPRPVVKASESESTNDASENDASDSDGEGANKKTADADNANKDTTDADNASEESTKSETETVNSKENTGNANTDNADSESSGSDQRDSAFRDRIVEPVKTEAETPVDEGTDAADGTRRLLGDAARQCRSAFAYCQGKRATKQQPRSSLPLCLSPGRNEGWSNLIASEQAMECTLYVGASGCDVTKAEAIGVLFVDSNRAEVVFEVDDDSRWVLSQLHVYVGDGKYPRARDNSPASPADYPRVEVFEDPTKTATVELDDGDLQVGHYVIAHASVCAEESFDEIVTE
jgi:hypothetical protein